MIIHALMELNPVTSERSTTGTERKLKFMTSERDNIVTGDNSFILKAEDAVRIQSRGPRTVRRTILAGRALKAVVKAG
jgi:hypothetical protein